MTDRPEKLDPPERPGYGNDYPRSPCCGQVMMGNPEDGWACHYCGKSYTLYYRERDTDDQDQ